MHEFSITQNILSIALDKAKEVKSNRITKINLTIGELSGVVDECVKFYFGFLSKDTIAAGADLAFEKTQLQLRCRNCDVVFPLTDSNWACPTCREQKVEVISGRECYVNSIEVD